MRQYGALFALGALSACGGSAHVERVVSASEVDRYRVGTMHEVAIVDGVHETPLGGTTRVHNGRIEQTGDAEMISVQVGEDDVIEADGKGRIIGVRRKDKSVVRFVPGTATSPEGADVVRGMPLSAKKKGEATLLAPTARVRMSGELSTDDVLPDGTRVSSSRFTFGLVAGSVIFSLGYLPSLVVGATSKKKYDRSLLVPIFGPWISLANRTGCGVRPTTGDEATIRAYADCEVTNRAAKVLLPVGGIVQGVGALLLIIGLPESTKVEEPRGQRAHVRLEPVVTGDRAGAVVSGEF